MLDEDDDPFDLDEDDQDETANQETLAKEDTPNDAENPKAEKPKRKSNPKNAKPTSGCRDYGRTGITTPDPADLDELTKLLKTSIKKLGAYESLTAIANAFEQYGVELNSDPKTVGRGGAYLDAATTVDAIVNKLSKGTRK